jgi:hypothetical protein
VECADALACLRFGSSSLKSKIISNCDSIKLSSFAPFVGLEFEKNLGCSFFKVEADFAFDRKKNSTVTMGRIPILSDPDGDVEVRLDGVCKQKMTSKTSGFSVRFVIGKHI